MHFYDSSPSNYDCSGSVGGSGGSQFGNTLVENNSTIITPEKMSLFDYGLNCSSVENVDPNEEIDLMNVLVPESTTPTNTSQNSSSVSIVEGKNDQHIKTELTHHHHCHHQANNSSSCSSGSSLTQSPSPLSSVNQFDCNGGGHLSSNTSINNSSTEHMLITDSIIDGDDADDDVNNNRVDNDGSDSPSLFDNSNFIDNHRNNSARNDDNNSIIATTTAASNVTTTTTHTDDHPLELVSDFTSKYLHRNHNNHHHPHHNHNHHHHHNSMTNAITMASLLVVGDSNEVAT